MFNPFINLENKYNNCLQLIYKKIIYSYSIMDNIYSNV